MNPSLRAIGVLLGPHLGRKKDPHGDILRIGTDWYVPGDLDEDMVSLAARNWFPYQRGGGSVSKPVRYPKSIFRLNNQAPPPARNPATPPSGR